MNDEEARKEFFEKLKKMPQEDLLASESAAISANRLISVSGIITIFFMVSFPYPLVIIAGAIFTFILANVSSGIDIVIREIRNQLQKFDK